MYLRPAYPGNKTNSLLPCKGSIAYVSQFLHPPAIKFKPHAGAPFREASQDVLTLVVPRTGGRPRVMSALTHQASSPEM